MSEVKSPATVAEFFGWLLLIALTIAAGFVPAYAAHDIAGVYDIPIIQNLTVVKMWALMIVINLLLGKSKLSEAKPKEFVDALISTWLNLLGVLIIWGIAILVHKIIN